MTLLEQTLSRIQPKDAARLEPARQRLGRLTMPYWAMGRLCDLAVELCAMTGSAAPRIRSKAVAVFAGDHGVVAEGVSLSPPEVTGQMVRNFLAGGAGISVLSRTFGARLVVVDVGVASDLSDLDDPERFWPARVAAGAGNIAIGPAMTRIAAEQAMETGIRAALTLADGHSLARARDAGWDNDAVDGAEPADLLATGEMGIGNTTPSSAVVACLTGRPATEVTGRGTGMDDEGVARKARVVERALAVNRPDPADPLDVLSKVGGYELAAMTGFMLGAAAKRRPVVLDGFICTAAALLAQGLCPAAADYMIAGHRSQEIGHRAAHERLGLEPLLDLGLRLGEGTGAVLAFPLVEAAARIFTDMASFADAAVDAYDPRQV